MIPPGMNLKWMTRSAHAQTVIARAMSKNAIFFETANARNAGAASASEAAALSSAHSSLLFFPLSKRNDTAHAAETQKLTIYIIYIRITPQYVLYSKNGALSIAVFVHSYKVFKC